MPPTRMPELDRETERRLASGLYNDVWRAHGATQPPEQDDEMLHAAHASRYHWGRVGEPVNLARGEWLCSRVYAILGRPEPTIWHAKRCLELLADYGGGENWEEAAVYEALARACSVGGNRDESRQWVPKAREALKSIPDDDDRKTIEADVKTIN